MPRLFFLLCLLTLAACGGDDLVLPVEGVPDDITIVQGDDQSGRAGDQLPDPVVALVTDSRDRPVRGVRVAFEFNGGSGSNVTPDTVTTDADGRAAVRIVLGTETGTADGEARVVGDDDLTAEFSVTVLPGTAAALAIRTQPPATATVGAPFSRSPVVQVRDAAGNDVRTGGIAVTAAIASGGGTLAGVTTRATDANGRATFDGLRITGAAGTHTLIFAANGHTSVTSQPIDVREAANGAPSAANDSYTTTEGFERTLAVAAPGVLANDTDPDGNALRAEGASDPPHGRVSLNANGSFAYNPDPDYFGEDSFTYRAVDATGASSTATVIITVLPVNDSPRFEIRGGNQTAPANGGAQRVANFAEVTSPGAPNETGQTVQFLVEVDAQGAALFSQAPAISPDGTLTYTPAGTAGTAQVTVRARDNGGTENGGNDTSDPKTFTITLTSSE